jgi:hypothetical protein
VFEAAPAALLSTVAASIVGVADLILLTRRAIRRDPVCCWRARMTAQSLFRPGWMRR